MFAIPVPFGSAHVRIVRRFEAADDATRLRFATVRSATVFTARLLAEPLGWAALRRCLAGAPPQTAGSKDDLRTRAARMFHLGELVAIPLPHEPLRKIEALEGEEQVAEASRTEHAWVAFVVLDDVTGEPVAGVKLGIRLPEGGRAEHTTPGSGTLEFDPCARGTCTVDTSLGDATLGSVLELVRFGAPTERPLEGIPFPNPDDRKPVVVRVTHHRVRSGESLASIAKGAGLDWKELARFNFGTDAPRKVNVALREQVGCHKRTADGHNYLFHDHDYPGIVYVPSPLCLEHLSTDQTHTLVVRPLTRPPRPFYFSH